MLTCAAAGMTRTTPPSCPCQSPRNRRSAMPCAWTLRWGDPPTPFCICWPLPRRPGWISTRMTSMPFPASPPAYPRSRPTRSATSWRTFTARVVSLPFSGSCVAEGNLTRTFTRFTRHRWRAGWRTGTFVAAARLRRPSSFSMLLRVGYVPPYRSALPTGGNPSIWTLPTAASAPWSIPTPSTVAWQC